jgi:predicted transcriptional regulator
MPDMPRAGQSDRPGRTKAGRRPPATAALEFPEVVDASGCTAIPNSVLDDDRLSAETRLVYIMLRRLAATSHHRPVDQRELARLIGMPLHQLPRHLRLLEQSGHIQVRAEGRPSAQTHIRYRLAEPMAPQSQGRRAASDSGGLSLVGRLVVMGVDPEVAGRLVVTYPIERVAGALRAAHRRRPRPHDPARGSSRPSARDGSLRTPRSPPASSRRPKSRRSWRGSDAPTPPCPPCPTGPTLAG